MSSTAITGYSIQVEGVAHQNGMGSYPSIVSFYKPLHLALTKLDKRNLGLIRILTLRLLCCKYSGHRQKVTVLQLLAGD